MEPQQATEPSDWNRASMEPPGADGGEGAGGRRSLAVRIVTPAGDGTVGLPSTGVGVPGADGGEGAGGRLSLAHVIAIEALIGTPAGDGTVGLHPADV